MTQQASSEQARRLREQLEKLSWPQLYMFKFLLPNDPVRINSLKSILPTNSKITTTTSKGDKYICITCVANMESADRVMEINTQAGNISGIMSL